jgi:hypothetical protein
MVTAYQYVLLTQQQAQYVGVSSKSKAIPVTGLEGL